MYQLPRNQIDISSLEMKRKIISHSAHVIHTTSHFTSLIGRGRLRNVQLNEKKHVKLAKLECHCLNKQICDVISAVIGVVAQAPLIHSRLKTLGTLWSVLRVSQDSDH